ncbi:MAG: hypothetical protein MUC36_28485 [Planctomycetes bacterium]|jgi:hypothetical protein|nr:hypothetical protein [Planctomycetota bacterium]
MTDPEPLPAAPGPARAPPFEELLIGALASLETDGEAGLAQYLAAHPTVATLLLRHVERLREIGLAGDEEGWD